MPNGFGDQPLYILSATFVPSSLEVDDGPAAAAADAVHVPYPLSDYAIKGINGSMSVRFGYRTVELVQNILPGGKSFYFKVNGVPIPGIE